MRQSRLARRSINQSKNQLYVSIVGIIVLLFVVINFGPSLIGTLGTLIDALTGKSNQAAKIVSNADIQPPMLDPQPDATPSANITVTGRAYYENGNIELFVNGKKTDEVSLDNSQSFKFEDVQLSEGDNYIKARMSVNDKDSDYSDEEKITYTKSAPKLDVSFPSDHQSFSHSDQQITVTGTTDSSDSVTVNGFIAIVDNSGNFTYDMNLSSGDNKLTIVATSPSGQTTSKDLTVSYSQ